MRQPLECTECRATADDRAAGWRGYRIDDPDEGEPPELAFYCPACASREFDFDKDERTID